MNIIKFIKFFLIAAVFVMTACKDEEDVAVTSVSLNPAALSLVEGDTQQLTSSVTPADATDKEVMWKSANSDIAKVSPDGLVTAVTYGKTEIYVITWDGNKSATCQVTVLSATTLAEEVSLDLEEFTLGREDKVQLTPIVLPADATNKNVVWSSSDNDVAQVNSRGEVTGVSLGTAKITATTVSGGFQAHCNITVIPQVIVEDDMVTIVVYESDNMPIIRSAIERCVADDRRNITVLFESGKTYPVDGQINLPNGDYNINFVGTPGDKQPLLVAFEVRINGVTVNNVTFRNLKIDLDRGYYLFEVSNNSTHNDIIIEDCYIFNLARGVYRGGNPSIGNKVIINNCWLHQTGTYGIANTQAGTILQSFSITNSTLTEVRTYISEINSSTSLTLSNVTFCNIYYTIDATSGDRMQRLFRFDGTLGVNAPITIEKCIFAGANSGQSVQPFTSLHNNFSYFEGSYKTNDLIEGGFKFTNITEVPLSATELFVDAEGGDFHIKEGVDFAGRGEAGDPRWWQN